VPMPMAGEQPEVFRKRGKESTAAKSTAKAPKRKVGEKRIESEDKVDKGKDDLPSRVDVVTRYGRGATMLNNQKK
jgi:hypothetical protein